VDLARAGGRQSRKPVNQAQGIGGIGVRAEIWPKMAGIAVNQQAGYERVFGNRSERVASDAAKSLNVPGGLLQGSGTV